jgi:hypothetical protein
MHARNHTASFSDVKDHARKAARETLLAVRTVVDAGLRALGDDEKRGEPDTPAKSDEAIHPRPGDVESPPPV